MPVYHWQDMKTTAFRALDPEKTILVFPVGSTEQHGPHLPVGVDACLADAVLARAAALAPEVLTLLILPTLPYGKSNEHDAFDGTISLSVDLLIKVWMEIAEAALRPGFRKILFLNGHGGQTAVTQIVARDLRVKHNVLAVAIDWWSLRPQPTLFPEEERIHGIHAGAEETSMMLSLRPDLVETEACANFAPTSLTRQKEYPLLFGERRLAWQARDLHPEGACGDARLATKEAGQKLIEEAAQSIVGLLEEMRRFPSAEMKA